MTTKPSTNRAIPAEPKALQLVTGPTHERQAFAMQMFQEDLQTGIFPYRMRIDHGERISIVADEEERNKIAAVCEPIGRGSSHSAEDSVEGAVQDIALRLAHYGVALFELLHGSNSELPTLSSFNPSHVWSLPGFYLQLAPRSSWKYAKKKYALLEKSGIWRVKLPAKLGTAREHRSLLSQLSAWPELGPDFLPVELHKGRFPEEFRVGDYNRMLRIHNYRVTRKWGWACRNLSLNYTSEYYQFYRTLTFKWAQALMREHIVSELSALFTRLNISAKLSLQGVRSASEILEIRERMRQGSLDFAGAYEALGLA